MYDQENDRNPAMPSYQRLKTMERRHTDQMSRTRNFKARNERIETGVLVNHKGRKSTLRGQCSRGGSCSFSHGSNLGQRVQSSSPALKAQTQTDGRRPSKGFCPREKVLLEEKAGKRIRRVIFGILPYAKITRLYRDANSATNVCSDTEADGQPSKKSKISGGKGSVALLKGSIQLCCVVCPKCEPQERNPCAPKFEDRTFQETLQQERCARRSMHGTWRKKSASSKKQGLGYILLPYRSMGNAGTLFERSQRSENSW